MDPLSRSPPRGSSLQGRKRTLNRIQQADVEVTENNVVKRVCNRSEVFCTRENNEQGLLFKNDLEKSKLGGTLRGEKALSGPSPCQVPPRVGLQVSHDKGNVDIVAKGEALKEIQNAHKFPGLVDRVDPNLHSIPCGYSSKMKFYPFPPYHRENPFVQCTFSQKKGKPICSGAGLNSPAFFFPDRFRLPKNLWLDSFRFLLDSSILEFRLSDVITDLHEKSDVGDVDVCREPKIISQVADTLKQEIERASLGLIQKLKSSPSLSIPTEAWEVPAEQPFRLALISFISDQLGDWDSGYPLMLVEGFHLGDEIAIPDSGLWPLNTSSKDKAAEKIDHLAMFEENYKSWLDFEDLGQQKLDEDVLKDFIKGPFSWDQVLRELDIPDDYFENNNAKPPLSPPTLGKGMKQHKGEFKGPPGCATAKLGAVMEDFTTNKLRVVMDCTIAGVNGKARLPETQNTPSLHDVMSGMGDGFPSWFALKVDVKSAFKRIKILRAHWKKTMFQTKKGWYFATKCPFGARASGYWWIRLNSLIHRVIGCVLQDVDHGGFVYVDDSLWLIRSDIAFKVIPRILLILNIFGVPLSWEKTQLGFVVDWVGFVLNLRTRKAFLSQTKLRKFEELHANTLKSKAIPKKHVESIAGKLSWASVLFPLARCLLYPIFRAIYSPAIRENNMIYHVQPIQQALTFWLRLIKSVSELKPENTTNAQCEWIFRVDACASGDEAYLGGWIMPVMEAKKMNPDFSTIEWFACDVPTDLFPECKDNKSKMISACEMLALVVGLRLWGDKLKNQSVDASVVAKSDSMVTVLSCLKGYAKSPNLAFVLREVCGALFDARAHMAIQHIPGVLNYIADGLSRRKKELLKLMSPGKQRFVTVDLMFKEAIAAFADQDFNPFLGVCVGNAKNPGPEASTKLVDCLALSFPRFIVSSFCDNVGIFTIGDWRAFKISPADFVDDCLTEPWANSEGFSREVLLNICTVLNKMSVSKQVLSLPKQSVAVAPKEQQNKIVASSLPSSVRGVSALAEEGGVVHVSTVQNTGKKLYSEKAIEIAKWACSSDLQKNPTSSRVSDRKRKFLQIAGQDDLVKSAVETLQTRFYADSTWKAHAAEVKLYILFCRKRFAEPFPLNVEQVIEFASTLFQADYRGADKYITAIIRQQRIKFKRVPEEVTQWRSVISRALGRGQGAPHHMEPVTVLMLRKMAACVTSLQDKFLFSLILVEWFFMLRADEVRNLWTSDVTFLSRGETRAPGPRVILFEPVPSFTPEMVMKGTEFRVRIRIRQDKTNQKGIPKFRMLDCVCNQEKTQVSSSLMDKLGKVKTLPICPVHAAAWLCQHHSGSDVEKLNMGNGYKPPGDTFVLHGLRQLLTRCGIPTTTDGETLGIVIQMFGTHSLRRGAAQALAYAGWSLEDIKFFGRWLSNAVETYLLEAPIVSRGHLLASAMVSGAVLSVYGTAAEKPLYKFIPKEVKLNSTLRVEIFDQQDISAGFCEGRVKSIDTDGNAILIPLDDDYGTRQKVNLNTTSWTLITE